jgi:hypothetical protein
VLGNGQIFLVSVAWPHFWYIKFNLYCHFFFPFVIQAEASLRY